MLQAAQLSLKRGDTKAAIGALERALRELRRASPLELSHLTVLAATPEGLGMYTPAPGARVNGSTLLLYAEVRNFVPRREGEMWRVHLSTRASFFYADGEPIVRGQPIGEHTYSTRVYPDETFVVLELHVRGLPPQPYLVGIEVTDEVSGKRASARTRFEVAAPKNAGGAR